MIINNSDNGASASRVDSNVLIILGFIVVIAAALFVANVIAPSTGRLDYDAYFEAEGFAAGASVSAIVNFVLFALTSIFNFIGGLLNLILCG